jgi:hypothetical protein
VVSDKNNHVNHPIYVFDEDLGCCILTINEDYKEAFTPSNSVVIPTYETNGIWNMYFDGAYFKEEAGAGITLISPIKEEIHFSYKMEFKATNNVIECEALILGLEEMKKMQITALLVFGDSELVVQQIKWFYQKKHPKMRIYINQI